ncbi:MAG: hypothetical protein FWD61_00695 [Phycisphaerales bacterium]|nr:hypothetical protein [Phycisphaerales bacterium]
MIRIVAPLAILFMATSAFALGGPNDATLINKLDNSLRQRAAATRFKNRVSSSDLQKNTLAGILQSVQNGTGLELRVDWPALKIAGLAPATAVKISGHNLSYQQYIYNSCKYFNVSLVLYFKELRGGDGEFALTTLAACPAGVLNPAERSGSSISEDSNTWQRVDSQNGDKYQMVRVYDVRSLMPVGLLPAGWTRDDFAKEISEGITTVVAHDSWECNGGIIGAIRIDGGRLIVRQTRDNHVAIAEFLQVLAKGLKPPIPGKVPVGWEIADSPRDAAVRLRLNANLKELVVDQQSFEKVINYLQETTGLTFNVNWPAIEAAGVDRHTPVTINLYDVPIRKALLALLSEINNRGAGINYTIDHGGITLSTYEDLNSEKYQTIRIYDIRTLLLRRATNDRSSEDIARDLIDVIQTTIAHESWCEHGGTIGVIRCFSTGILIINQTRDNHVAIAQLFQQLTATPRKPIIYGKIPAGWDYVDSPEDQAVNARLDQPAAPLNIRNQSLESVINSLRANYRLNMFVNWTALECLGIDRGTPITLALKKTTLRKTFDAILSQTNDDDKIGYIVHDGKLIISTREDLLSNKYLTVWAYDLRPFLRTDRSDYQNRLRNLIDTIQATIAPDTWNSNGGAIGSIRELNGRLVIQQTRKNHVAIAQFLKRLANAPRLKNR